MPRKHPSHHCTTTTILGCWHKAGWVHGFMLLALNSNRTIWASAEIELHQTRQCFYSPRVSSFGEPEWSSELPYAFCQLEPVWPFSVDLSHQQGASVHRTATHWLFFDLRTILRKLYRLLRVKITGRSAVTEIFTLAPTLKPRSKSLRSHLSPFWR